MESNRNLYMQDNQQYARNNVLSHRNSYDYDSTCADPVSSRMLIEASIKIIKQRQDKSIYEMWSDTDHQQTEPPASSIANRNNYSQNPNDRLNRNTKKKNRFQRLTGMYLKSPLKKEG